MTSVEPCVVRPVPVDVKGKEPTRVVREHHRMILEEISSDFARGPWHANPPVFRGYDLPQEAVAGSYCGFALRICRVYELSGLPSVLSNHHNAVLGIA